MKVQKDVEKIGRYLERGACALGYMIVFEDCDWGFAQSFADEALTNSGCRVRFIRSY